jgi:hypothetical protein
MKLPSIFKTASHQRFSIKPRYYDPIKEEIEERTSRIKKELEQEGLIEPEEAGGSELPRRSAMKGSFSTYRGMKTRDTSVFNSTGIIRTLLFLGMVAAAFGYIYIGPSIFRYLAYIGIGAGGAYFLVKFLKKRKNA